MWEVVLLAYGIGILWFIDRLEVRRLVAEPRIDRWSDWKAAMDRCRLRITGGASKADSQLTARAGPVEVRLEAFGMKGKDSRIVVAAPMALDFQEVTIRPQTSPAAREVTVGDPGFDDALSIEGPVLPLLALLDTATRRRMCAVNAAGWLEISAGRIEAVVSRGKRVSEALPALLEIVRRLGTPADIPRSLVENVKGDSEGGVRLQNLLALIREVPGDPGTVEALRAACSDWSPATRLRAARELGAEGRDALLKVALSLDDDAVSAEAVSILDRAMPVERAKALLKSAWGTGRLKTALACVEVLGRGGAAAVGPLAEVLEGQNVKLAVAAVHALAATGSPDAEPLLIQALRHEETDVQMAAA